MAINTEEEQIRLALLADMLSSGYPLRNGMPNLLSSDLLESVAGGVAVTNEYFESFEQNANSQTGGSAFYQSVWVRGPKAP